MNKDEIDKVFNFLELHANKDKLLYFRFISQNNIEARYKNNDITFAYFDPQTILKIIDEEENIPNDKEFISEDEPLSNFMKEGI